MFRPEPRCQHLIANFLVKLRDDNLPSGLTFKLDLDTEPDQSFFRPDVTPGLRLLAKLQVSKPPYPLMEIYKRDLRVENTLMQINESNPHQFEINIQKLLGFVSFPCWPQEVPVQCLKCNLEIPFRLIRRHNRPECHVCT
eukprot:TRINITY_DN110308_c0_g1_i1.p1 TRINITY_DN110308_c0_g1~~TRINITY_DN110308_c0_g1_i1.p1  ORF type:complete len:140 (+),score=3.02 TRINITY_DN110308_c0_g1_i1:253-672(+)